MTDTSLPWWKTGVIYQIYPRSFQDSNGDGIGDLIGITSRLDYLADLGIDAIWISPFYPSPMADFGYDVMDYRGVDPIFGTLADFDHLVAETHARGLKLILDFVPNHSSNRHPWFEESHASRSNPKRDWYIWRDPAPGGGPPNNWLSVFGGSAWEFDPQTEQYYYHAFLKEQPDLNWTNPDLKSAMFDTMRFWLKRGVDGFRVDVIWHLAKDHRFPDEPRNLSWCPGMDPYDQLLHVYSADQPAVHQLIAQMRRVVNEFPDRVLIGETYLPFDRLALYYGEHGEGVHLPFNFHLITTDFAPRAIAAVIAAYERALPPFGWPNWVLGNHDRSRIASRVGAAKARLAAMLLMTLRGTPTHYYGDELGLSDVAIPPALVQDPWEKNVPGLGLGRDPVRTPMPWDAASPEAGFTRGVPWLPLNPDWRQRNVRAQSADPQSDLALYRQLFALRRGSLALQAGSIRVIRADAQILVYERKAEDGTLLVALNFSDEPASISLPGPARRLLSTAPGRAEDDPPEGLRPYEGVVLAFVG
jgi:alpha-glucosidase